MDSWLNDGTLINNKYLVKFGRHLAVSLHKQGYWTSQINGIAVFGQIQPGAAILCFPEAIESAA